MSGTIQRIDARSLTLLPDNKLKPINFAWDKKWTHFVRNDALTAPDSLHPGTHVQIRYRSPFFGPQWVSRVFWRAPFLSERN